MNYNNERGLRSSGMGNNNVQPVGGPTYGESPASGPAPTTAGHHKHDILNKLDPRVDSTKDNRPIASNHNGGNGVPEGTYGPHSSRLANALDPRVDSDMDSKGPRTANAAVGSGGPTMRGATGPGTTGMMGGNNNNNNIPEGTYGPHNSRLANALDPRVDSDADRNRMAPGGVGGAGNIQQSQTHGVTGAGAGYGGAGAGAGYGNNTMVSGPGPAPKTAGPHKSDLLNKLDPRVDSKTGAVSGSYGGGVGGPNTGAGAGTGRY